MQTLILCAALALSGSDKSMPNSGKGAPATVQPAICFPKVDTSPVVRKRTIVLTVTDTQLQLMWTTWGWMWVRVPVTYTVLATWNEDLQAYGYYDRAGNYKLYRGIVIAY